jgi:hypothetical protein
MANDVARQVAQAAQGYGMQTPFNGNPGGANNSRPQGYGYSNDSQLGAVYMGGQNAGLGRYRPPTYADSGMTQWADHGGYNYNLPNAYGPNDQFARFGNTGQQGSAPVGAGYGFGDYSYLRDPRQNPSTGGSSSLPPQLMQMLQQILQQRGAAPSPSGFKPPQQGTGPVDSGGLQYTPETTQAVTNIPVGAPAPGLGGGGGDPGSQGGYGGGSYGGNWRSGSFGGGRGGAAAPFTPGVGPSISGGYGFGGGGFGNGVDRVPLNIVGTPGGAGNQNGGNRFQEIFRTIMSNMQPGRAMDRLWNFASGGGT